MADSQIRVLSLNCWLEVLPILVGLTLKIVQGPQVRCQAPRREGSSYRKCSFHIFLRYYRTPGTLGLLGL